MNETSTSRAKSLMKDLAIALAVLLPPSAVFVFTNLDMDFESLFLAPETNTFDNFRQPWYFLYKYGPIVPSVVLGGFAVALVGGFFAGKLKKHRKMALYALLTAAIGPGLIANAIFKEHWGRPRPYYVAGLGGTAEYLPLFVKGPYVPNPKRIERLKKKTGLFWELYKKHYPQQGLHNSFPSGHAAYAFFLFIFYFILRKTRYRSLAFWSVMLYAGCLGLGRSVQGRHFPSDILWSAGIAYLTALVLYYLMGMDKSIWYEKQTDS
jgi:lipid A 4'-phosphatase